MVPLSDFYHFKLTTQTEVDAVNKLIGGNVHDTNVSKGDFVVSGGDARNDEGNRRMGLGHILVARQAQRRTVAEDRPDGLKPPWSNYLMDVAFDMDTPTEPDGKPNVCMNPWLEARFPNGMVSNCMTCHQRAVWPPQPFRPITRGRMKPDHPYFAGKTKLDFLWSIAYEQR